MKIVKAADCEIVMHPFLVMKAGAYWCLHCERVSRAVEWRDNDFECPYVDCDGSASDMTPFGDFEIGKVYPVGDVWKM